MNLLLIQGELFRSEAMEVFPKHGLFNREVLGYCKVAHKLPRIAGEPHA
jgi:hypothetical protein